MSKIIIDKLRLFINLEFIDFYFGGKLEESDNNSRKQKEKLKISRWKIFGAIFIIALIITIYVDNVVRVNKIYQEIRQVQKKIELLNDNNEIYRRRIIQLQSPDRIITIAKNKLNMVEIDSIPEIIYLDE